MVEVELLDSDRVLFLVWKFLLESNFRETAAKLQKEWQVKHPHRDFAWARHVQSRALVALLQRGLQFEALEREFRAREASPDSAADVSEQAPFGVFGPLVTQVAPTVEDVVARLGPPEGDEDDGDFEVAEELEQDIPPKKRPAQRRRSSPAKRQRLSNGFPNGTVDAATAMEVDHPGANGHAYPSPLEGEQPPTPVPRTDGPAVSTQADAVRDLTAETTFLQLSNEDPSDPTATNANLPLLMHCSWNPQDPTLLAAAGSDTLARVWTISAPSSQNHVPAHVNPASELILADRNIPHNADVTAMAWNHEGSQIAIATQFEDRAKVTVYDLNSAVVRDWDLPEPPVIKMKWNTEDSFILTISPDGDGALLTVFPVNGDSKPEPRSHFLQHDIAKEPPDVAWCSETEFVVCGGNMLRALQYRDGDISVSRKFETREGDELCHVRYDTRSKLLATGSEKGYIDIWQHDGQHKPIKAHEGPVTGLTWQPAPDGGNDSMRLIASSGEDGTIALWNARKPESKAQFTMSAGCPVVALSFTPDGNYIAAATTRGVVVYKVGDTDLPYANWSRVPHPSWLSPKMSPKPSTEGSEEDIHLLCWDSTGQKLAYGVNSRLAVINFLTPPASEAMELE